MLIYTLLILFFAFAIGYFARKKEVARRIAKIISTLLLMWFVFAAALILINFPPGSLTSGYGALFLVALISQGIGFPIIVFVMTNKWSQTLETFKQGSLKAKLVESLMLLPLAISTIILVWGLVILGRIIF